MKILVDLDGVLADFARGLEEKSLTAEKAKLLPGFYLELKLVKNAFWAISELDEMGFDIFICSSSPTQNSKAFEEKFLWIERNFGKKFHRKVIFTHRKDLIHADFLIDDRKVNGAADFQGTFLQFGKDGIDWLAIINFFKTIKSK